MTRVCEICGIDISHRHGNAIYCEICGPIEKREAWKRSAIKSWETAKEAHIKLIYRLGGKCNHCDFLDKRILQIDHIYGGGTKERKSKGWRFYLDLDKLSDEELKSRYQLLCPNCNWIKRIERGEEECHLKGL